MYYFKHNASENQRKQPKIMVDYVLLKIMLNFAKLLGREIDQRANNFG